jgi:hypothetical protein
MRRGPAGPLACATALRASTGACRAQASIAMSQVNDRRGGARLRHRSRWLGRCVRLSGRAEHRRCTRAVLGILELHTFLPLVVSVERTVIGSGLGTLDRAALRITQWPLLIAAATARDAHQNAGYQGPHFLRLLVPR